MQSLSEKNASLPGISLEVTKPYHLADSEAKHQQGPLDRSRGSAHSLRQPLLHQVIPIRDLQGKQGLREVVLLEGIGCLLCVNRHLRHVWIEALDGVVLKEGRGAEHLAVRLNGEGPMVVAILGASFAATREKQVLTIFTRTNRNLIQEVSNSFVCSANGFEIHANHPETLKNLCRKPS